MRIMERIRKRVGMDTDGNFLKEQIFSMEFVSWGRKDDVWWYSELDRLSNRYVSSYFLPRPAMSDGPSSEVRLPREGGESTLPQNRRRWEIMQNHAAPKSPFQLRASRSHVTGGLRISEVCFVRDSHSQPHRNRQPALNGMTYE